MRLKGCGKGIVGVYDELVPGTTRSSPSPHTHSPPNPSLPDSPFSSVSSFPPASGWRQAGPPGAFKSLLGVCGGEAGPSIPDRHPKPPHAITASQERQPA